MPIESSKAADAVTAITLAAAATLVAAAIFVGVAPLQLPASAEHHHGATSHESHHAESGDVAHSHDD